jgi:hypothetical protein
MLPALELIETAAEESVAAPVTVNPSNPDQVVPAKVTVPNVVAVFPSANVTLLPNLRFDDPALIPELPANVP